MMPEFIIKTLMPVKAKMTPTCEVVSQKISESNDQPLSLSDRQHVRLNLMGCALCAGYEKQLLAVRQMLQEHPDQIKSRDNAAKLTDEVKTRIKQKINRKNDHDHSSHEDAG